MKIQVKVKPGARKTEVERKDDGTYRVSVKAPAQEGKANEALREALSEFFNVPKSYVTVLKGNSSRLKTVELPG